MIRKSYKVEKGPHFALERKKKAAELTKEMLDSGEWATVEFKVCMRLYVYVCTYV